MAAWCRMGGGVTPTEFGNMTMHLSHVLCRPVVDSDTEELHCSRDTRSTVVSCGSGSDAGPLGSNDTVLSYGKTGGVV